MCGKTGSSFQRYRGRQEATGCTSGIEGSGRRHAWHGVPRLIPRANTARSSTGSHTTPVRVCSDHATRRWRRPRSSRSVRRSRRDNVSLGIALPRSARLRARHARLHPYRDEPRAGARLPPARLAPGPGGPGAGRRAHLSTDAPRVRDAQGTTVRDAPASHRPRGWREASASRPPAYVSRGRPRQHNLVGFVWNVPTFGLWTLEGESSRHPSVPTGSHISKNRVGQGWAKPKTRLTATVPEHCVTRQAPSIGEERHTCRREVRSPSFR